MHEHIVAIYISGNADNAHSEESNIICVYLYKQNPLADECV